MKPAPGDVMVPTMSSRVCALALLALSSSCSSPRGPLLSPSFDTALGEGKNEGALPRRSASSPGASGAGGAAASADAVPNAGTAGAASSPGPSKADPPDPEPLRLAEQWEYELEMKRGTITVLAVQRRTFPQPVVTARRFGRYALELWIGSELVDRVRFDFPGLALDGAPPQGRRRPVYSTPNLTNGAEVRQKVLVPNAARARRARLLDRATGEAMPIPWPPDEAAGNAPKPAAPTP